MPADADKDLTHIAGREGTITYIAGRVLDRDGRPISGAWVEIWQCDANGRYHHVRDGRVGPPPDENFKGYGQTLTDATGGSRFPTILPVPYPGRTPHIHFAVSASGFPRLITQMYVAGEPQNGHDGVLMGVLDPAACARLIVLLEPGALTGTFDIVLG